MMKFYPNVLILRLRMPVSDDLHSRNFVTKITKYEYVVDVPNVSSPGKTTIAQDANSPSPTPSSPTSSPLRSSWPRTWSLASTTLYVTLHSTHTDLN